MHIIGQIHRFMRDLSSNVKSFPPKQACVLGGALDGAYFTMHFFGQSIPIGKLQIVGLSAIAFVTLVNCGNGRSI